MSSDPSGLGRQPIFDLEQTEQTDAGIWQPKEDDVLLYYMLLGNSDEQTGRLISRPASAVHARWWKLCVRYDASCEYVLDEKALANRSGMRDRKAWNSRDYTALSLALSDKGQRLPVATTAHIAAVLARSEEQVVKEIASMKERNKGFGFGK